MGLSKEGYKYFKLEVDTNVATLLVTLLTKSHDPLSKEKVPKVSGFKVRLSLR